MASVMPACLRIIGYVFTIALQVFAARAITKPANPDDPRLLMFKGNQNRYLTGWNVALLVAHSVLGLICEYLLLKNSKNSNYKLPRHLKGARDRIFTNLVFPGSFLVATLFWTVFTINRELVFPEFLDEVVPNFTNHAIHTYVVPIVLYHALLQPRYEPKSHVHNCVHIFLHCSLYYVVVFYTYYEKNHWLYPILGKLANYPPLFFLFVSGIVLLTYFYYFMQWKLLKLLWGERPEAKEGKEKKVR